MCACTLPMVDCQAVPVAIEAKEAAVWALGLILATMTEDISELCAAGELATLACGESVPTTACDGIHTAYTRLE